MIYRNANGPAPGPERFLFFLQQNNSHELLISGGFSADSAVIANDAANP